MTRVEFYVDPSCPWAWVTSRWIKEVAPQRDLDVVWKSYCLEIRDDYGTAPAVPEARREAVIAAHAVSHRMLRIFEAVEASQGPEPIDQLYSEWGARFFHRGGPEGDELLADCIAACGLDTSFLDAADEPKWDEPIIEAMQEAYAFAGEKTQTPAIIVRSDPPHGFKGPVMAPAPTGEAALRMWDALVTLSSEPGFFEVTRARVNPPRPPT